MEVTGFYESLCREATIGPLQAVARYVRDSTAVGARFEHVPTGTTIDVLHFDAVPQALIWFRTIPPSDAGEPHATEHLVLGKGRKAKASALAQEMNLGSHSAFTARDRTVYHINAAGDPHSFAGLLFKFLDSLIKPDFTDEEIRREVWHLGAKAVPGTDTLALEEKGTVYLEMLSSFEKPGTLLWSHSRRLAYGPSHPMARESGGRPEALRQLRPEALRTFHSRYYRPGPGMGIVLALPWSADPEAMLRQTGAMLDKLAAPDDTLERLEWLGPHGTLRLPDPTPPEHRNPVLLPYPAESAQQSSPAVLVWPALGSEVPPRLLFRASLLWQVLAGDESSYLYEDLVDRRKRKTRLPIVSVHGSMMETEGYPSALWLQASGPELARAEALEEVRWIVAERLRWLASLEPGSEDLSEFNRRMGIALRALERSLREITETPPGFGFRGTGDFWFTHCLLLERMGGFDRDLLLGTEVQALEREMETGNPWKEVIEECRLNEPPFALAARPDPDEAKRIQRNRQQRLEQEAHRLAEGMGTEDLQEALRRLQAEDQRIEAALDSANPLVSQPSFMADPPMVPDDFIQTSVETLEIGGKPVPLCISRFEGITTAEVGVFYDLRGLPRESLFLLPLLQSSFAELGAPDPEGGWIAYDEVERALKMEIRSCWAAFSTSPPEQRPGRVELGLLASGLGPDETQRALDWLVRLIEASLRFPESVIPRLRQIAEREEARLSRLPLGAEEFWARNPAMSYRYGFDAEYLAATSIFTQQHWMERLAWQLKEPPGLSDAKGIEQRLWRVTSVQPHNAAAIREAFLGIKEHASQEDGLSPEAQKLLEGLAERLLSETASMEPASVPERIDALVEEALDDLQRSPTETAAEMQRLFAQIISRGPSRVLVTANRTDADGLAKAAAACAGAIGSLVEASEDLAPAPGTAELSPRDRNLIASNASARGADLSPNSPPSVAALLMESSSNAVIVSNRHLASYEEADQERLIDALAARLYAGGGPHGLFMRTWAAGLAYSNGVGYGPRNGLARYYAERCSDATATLRFVAGILSQAAQEARPEWLDYALAGLFDDYRGAGPPLARGRIAAAELADGLTPEIMEAFHRKAVELVRSGIPHNGYVAGSEEARRALLERVIERLGPVLAPILPGLRGTEGESARDRIVFLIGPRRQVDAFEAYMKAAEPGTSILRLYPADYWLP